MPMAEDRAALLERLTDAINTGVIPDDLLTPDFEIVNAATAVTDRTYHGREGGLQWRNDFFEVLKDDARFEHRIEAEAPECVVARLGITGTAAASDMALDFRWMAVFWFRDDRIARAVGFNSRKEAYEAAGLDEG